MLKRVLHLFGNQHNSGQKHAGVATAKIKILN